MARSIHSLSYVLPIRWTGDEDRQELTAYLKWLVERCSQVIVVDGSPPGVFARNAAAWSSLVSHVPPDADLRAVRMGKVAGVLTGVRRSHEETIVLADDDVRYDESGLSRMVDLLVDRDLVSPLELIRTVKAAGGWAVSVPDLYVPRLPPSTSRFWEQRTRQAYEEFATPVRMAGWLVIAPLSVILLSRRRSSPWVSRGLS
jgi:hypothetical protein